MMANSVTCTLKLARDKWTRRGLALCANANTICFDALPHGNRCALKSQRLGISQNEVKKLHVSGKTQKSPAAKRTGDQWRCWACCQMRDHHRNNNVKRRGAKTCAPYRTCAVEDEQCTVHSCHEEDCREEHHDTIQLATHTRTTPS